ncbi:MAG: hypothetical protein KGL29_07180 [Alphaproteobacteria bacterium]|nr:hypothetical protein [Alphaproteobacteria bacterium]
MPPPRHDEIEEVAANLERQFQKLDDMGLAFSAALVKVAHLDLQMRVHGISGEEIDIRSFALKALELADGTGDAGEAAASGDRALPLKPDNG